MTPFDANDYRKRVLARIEARGGVHASDPFEWYDLPLEDVRDRVVAAQVEAVWAHWQKSRDSPKYRGLVTALLEAHRSTGPLVLDRASRCALAEQVRQLRAARDAGRSGPLEQAVGRLVERFGGVPRSKLAGLRELGLASGLDAADVDERLARAPVLETRTAPPALVVPADVRRQTRADLDELGRLLGDEPFATLHDLLGLPPGASRDEVRAARDAAAARNRELRPDRRRALVDDLLAAVTRLLLSGDPDAYLDAVADDVADRLRPRLAAVLLVEDELTAAGARALLAEAQAAGLDPDRAARVLASLAAELGTAVPAAAPLGVHPPRTAEPAQRPATLLEPPSEVVVTPVHGGLLVRWRASASPGDVAYRVQRYDADGRANTVGTTRATELEVGAPSGAVPVYAVVARRAGQVSAEARSGALPVPALQPAGADLPPVDQLQADGDVLSWDWPPGITEVLVVWRSDAPPDGPDDPLAQRRKTTNTRYELDGGVPLPAPRPVHVAVHTCLRVRGALVTSPSAPPGARLRLPAVGGPRTAGPRP